MHVLRGALQCSGEAHLNKEHLVCLYPGPLLCASGVVNGQPCLCVSLVCLYGLYVISVRAHLGAQIRYILYVSLPLNTCMVTPNVCLHDNT